MRKNLLIISMVFFIAFCGKMFAPIKVVNKFMEGIKKHDVETAYSLLSQQSPYKQNKEIFGKFVTTRNITKYSFKNVEIKNGVAAVKGYLIDGGDRVNIQFNLVKENGEWRITGWQLITEK